MTLEVFEFHPRFGVSVYRVAGTCEKGFLTLFRIFVCSAMKVNASS